MSYFGSSSDRDTVAGKTHFFFFVLDMGERINCRPKFFNFATPTNSMIVGDTVYPFT